MEWNFLQNITPSLLLSQISPCQTKGHFCAKFLSVKSDDHWVFPPRLTTNIHPSTHFVVQSWLCRMHCVANIVQHTSFCAFFSKQRRNTKKSYNETVRRQKTNSYFTLQLKTLWNINLSLDMTILHIEAVFRSTNYFQLKN